MTKKEVVSLRNFFLGFPVDSSIKKILEFLNKDLDDVLPSEDEMYQELKGCSWGYEGFKIFCQLFFKRIFILVGFPDDYSKKLSENFANDKAIAESLYNLGVKKHAGTN